MAPKRTKVCTGWCAPTIIYAILAAVSTAVSVIHPDLRGGHERVAVFLAHAVNGLLWTGILFLLCKYCWKGVAWFLLLVPFVLAFLMLFFIAGFAVSLLRRQRVTVTKEKMMDYQDSYAHNAASVPGANKYPVGTLMNLSSVKPDPSEPTHAKSVCDYSARPSKFDVLTKKQMQSTGTFSIPPGGFNYTTTDKDTPSGCHEGFPPSPMYKYTMPSDVTQAQ